MTRMMLRLLNQFGFAVMFVAVNVSVSVADPHYLARLKKTVCVFCVAVECVMIFASRLSLECERELTTTDRDVSLSQPQLQHAHS